MRETNNYNTLPVMLGTVAVGFIFATVGAAMSDATWTGRGLLVIGLAAPITLAYLHFIVLTDAPWPATWSGFILGAVGSALMLHEPAWPIAAAMAGTGYALIGAGFIMSPTKPTPPGAFFVLGGALVLVNAVLFPNAWVLTMGYGALAFTFSFGAIASVRQALSGQGAAAGE